MAKLSFKYGAMSCGKSASILQVNYNYRNKGMNIVLMKPKRDTKGEKNIVSRIGLSAPVDYLIDKEEKILDILKDRLSNIVCILIDEVQFLTKDQITELFVISKIYDIPVICYGIRTDFKTNSFSGSQRLFELADEIEELENICDCGEVARFNARVINGKYVSDGEQVAIDGKDNVTYESLCGKCYLEKVIGFDKDNINEKIKILKKQ